MTATIPPNTTLLLVDDDPAIILAASRLLAEFGRCRFAQSASDALDLLRAEPVDLVLLDSEMPGMSGFELLQVMQSREDLAGIPVVLLTSHTDEATEEAAFAAGAVDYLSKPIRPGVLKARVSTQLRLQRALTEIRTLSRTDSLTGLANRRDMQERLSNEVARCDRNKAAVSLLMVDVDYFKQFNDHYGHSAGDRALKAVADELRLVATRPGDLASRWGGEEFLVFLSDTNEHGAMAVANRLHDRLAGIGLSHAASPLGRLAVSIGLATAHFATARGPSDDASGRIRETIERLLADADAALYRAKANGRNRSESALTR